MESLDRDRSLNRHRERPFTSATTSSMTSATEKASMGTLLMAILFVVSLFLLYKFADWSHNKQVNEAEASAINALVPPDKPPAAPGSAVPVAASANPAGQRAAEPGAAGAIVTKCTADGKTSYGDGPCVHGAVTTLVTTSPSQNVVALTRARTLPAAPETALRPAPVVAQNTAPADFQVSTAECQTLDARVKNLDGMSRQPQTLQAMDWIIDERQIARDQQLRLRCQ